MDHARKTASLLAVLGNDIKVDRRNPRLMRGATYAIWHDEAPLPDDAADLMDRWNESPIMQFGEFMAAGTVRFAADRAFAELSLRYVHDETGDNDRDVQVAVFAVDEGSVWVVGDLIADPDTGEGADPAVLANVCSMPADARREEVADRFLGHG